MPRNFDEILATLSPELRPILDELLKSGFEMFEIHGDKGFELVMDKPIPDEYEHLAKLGNVEPFDDFGTSDHKKSGIGFLCKRTRQTISGKSW